MQLAFCLQIMKSLKAKLISTAVTIAGLGSVIAFGLSSFAWYHANKKVDAQGMELRTMYKGEIVFENDSYVVYGYDIENDTPQLISGDLSLGSYNIFVPGRNSFNRRIIRTTILYPRGVEIGSSIKITINCLSDLLISGTQFVDEKISNLIQFKFYDNFDNRIHQVDEEHTVSDVYNECVELFDSIEESYSFVELSGATATKPDKVIEIPVNMPSLSQEADLYRTDFLIEYNYNDDLVAYYKEHADENFDISFFKDKNAIPFEQDVQYITFTLVRGGEDE